MTLHNDTIVALSTAHGGALHIIRLSGVDALKIVQPFISRVISKPRHAYFCDFVSSQGVVDQIVVTWFVAPFSFTGEDCIEISCHGSRWIASEIIRLLIENGARSATAGEFTRRAFMNGKLALSQAEAVGDLIAATSKASARVALSQMRGGYTQTLSDARNQLLNICSMLELELDFGEEEVEFASRAQLVDLLRKLHIVCAKLADSFALGNVLKNGIPVAIIGKPNVGKSTLLNALVGEQRAIVSEIAGTTRDYIEETVNIDGVEYRFIDTAGIRHTTDAIEAIGVERSMERMRAAKIVVQLVDTSDFERVEVSENQKLIVVQNKSDLGRVEGCDIYISAMQGIGIDELKLRFMELSEVGELGDNDIVVSNARHYELLRVVLVSIEEALVAIEGGISGDMIVASLNYGIDGLGEITGEITTDEILGNIFKNFCIGK